MILDDLCLVSTPIKLSFRRSLFVSNVLILSSACVQLRSQSRPDATTSATSNSSRSSSALRPDRSRPVSVRLSSSLIFGGPVQTYKTKVQTKSENIMIKPKTPKSIIMESHVLDQNPKTYKSKIDNLITRYRNRFLRTYWLMLLIVSDLNLRNPNSGIKTLNLKEWIRF